MKRSPQHGRRSGGFTLIELLTVIAIIGILAAILIPTVTKVRDQAKRAKCSSNVRQITMSLINYTAQDRNQRFPRNGNENDTNVLGAWAWDMSKSMVKLIVGQAGRDVIYCPAGMANVGDNMYDYAGNFAVSNYVLLIPATAQIPYPPGYPANRSQQVPVEQSPINVRLQSSYPTRVGAGIVDVPASQRPLVVDTVMRTGRDNYTDIQGGLAGNRTNHLNDRFPAGSNQGYVDGHVAWIPWTKMQQTPRTANDPSFFW